MASYLEGLFADYVDPELLRAKQQQQFTQNLTQSTDPRQFMATVGANMGQQLSQGVQGMFGPATTQEKLGEVLRNAEGNTPAERMQAIAEQLSRMPGMERQAMAAAAEASRLKSAELEAANKTRNVYEQVQVPMTDTFGRVIPGQFKTQSIQVTEYYNPETGQYERRSSTPSAKTGTGVSEQAAKKAIAEANKGGVKADVEAAKAALANRASPNVVAPAGGSVNPIIGSNRDIAGRTLGPAGLPDQRLPSGSMGVPGSFDTVTGRPSNVSEEDRLGMLVADRGRALQRGDIREAERLTNEINKIRKIFR